jgi:hypothetical protein
MGTEGRQVWLDLSVDCQPVEQWRWDAVVVRIGENGHQFGDMSRPLGNHDAELRHHTNGPKC